jgi:hypothetical protein
LFSKTGEVRGYVSADASADSGVYDAFLSVIAFTGNEVNDCVLTFEDGCELVLLREIVNSADLGVWREDCCGGETGDDCHGEIVAKERR